MVSISWAWYNGSYTMAPKPIKLLEMHYTMIQFLIKYKFDINCMDMYFEIKSLTPKDLIQLSHNAGIFSLYKLSWPNNGGLTLADMQT